MFGMFCCGSALEAPRAGTRVAANKTKTIGSLSSAQGDDERILEFTNDDDATHASARCLIFMY
jgi:hypothetical protein